MNLEVKIDQAEFNRLQRAFLRIKNEELGKPKMRKIFVKAVKPMIASIKSRTPVGKINGGALKKSIGIIPYLGTKSGSVFVGVRRDRTTKKTTTWYGRILEFGSKFIPKGKFTFFEPGVKSSVQQVADAIINELKRNIQKYGR